MARLVFSKTGNAVWISHLDLMRVFQRAFRRAGMLLKHSQGFTPHPCLSMAMPLSVGVSSRCEQLDFELAEEDKTPLEQIPALLNDALPEGIAVTRCLCAGRKLRELKWLEARLTLEYDHGVPQGAAGRISALLTGASLVVEKHGKNGPTQVDIAPMLHGVEVSGEQAGVLHLDAVVSAQNPTLNPLLLLTAVERYLPQDAPDFASCCRMNVYDEGMQPFC